MPPVEKYIGEPKPLNKRITPDEVTEVTKRLNNNKAAGNDGIPGELYKYAPPELLKIISESLNDALENHNNEINFGLSVLLPTPKPKKDPGPRPLNLLQMIENFVSNYSKSYQPQSEQLFINKPSSIQKR